MFNAVTNNPKLLKDSIDTIAQLIDEGTFKIKSDGIELIATDRAMVAVVHFKLNPTAFETFNCDKEAIIGLNLLNFLTILKRAGTEDVLKLDLKDEDNKLEIVLEGSSVRKFAIPLLEVSAEEIPPISQLEFSAQAQIKSNILEEGIADADVIADSIIIELDEDNLKMFAEGDSSRTELDVKKGSDLVDISVREKVKSRYPIDYLKKMIKASKISDDIKLQIGNDYPMRLEFKGNDASVTMVLAPRVSEE